MATVGGEVVGISVLIIGDTVDGGSVVGNWTGEPVVGLLVLGASVRILGGDGCTVGDIVGWAVVGATTGVLVVVAAVLYGPGVGVLFCASNSGSTVVLVVLVARGTDGAGVALAIGTTGVGEDAARNDEALSLFPFLDDVTRKAVRAAAMAATMRKQANRRFLVVPGLADMLLLEWLDSV